MLKSNLFFFVSPLLLSLFLYVFYRTDQTVINDLILSLVKPETYYFAKSYFALHVPLNSWLIFSLPGGLWVFSSSFISKGFYIRIKHFKLSCSFIPLIFAIGLEIAQGLSLVHGTFDFSDLIFILLFWYLADSSFNTRLKQSNLIQNFNLKAIGCILSYSIVFLAHVRQ